ncbi:MAG: hypothetical protein IKP00_13980 [Victivallales bacterium]|nr:hypothetical protein [Victivallales bacterium]
MGYKITGMGLICGLGNSPEEVFNRMCAGETAFRSIYTFDAEPYAQKNAGQLRPEENDRLTELFEDEDRALSTVRHAAFQALGKTLTAEELPIDERRALVLATNFGPMETMQWCWQERRDTQEIDSFTFAPANDYVKRIAKALGCGGPAVQLSMSCASGAAAVAAAWDFLAAGRADSVLVVAYDTLSDYSWCGLSNLKTITIETMRPFDAKRSGTIFSEGAAAILLEREEGSAAALGWVNGVATGNNAFHLTAPRPEAEGSRLVMEAALKSAGLEASAIDHVCAHATSTHANDETESAAIRNLLGTHASEVTVSAYKSQLGHLLGAAGLAEAIISILAMRKGISLPIVNLDEPDPKCMPLKVNTNRTEFSHFSCTLTNSAGIGGNNASTVLGVENAGSSRKISLDGKLYLRNMAWVLPENVGNGAALLKNPAWTEYAKGCNEKQASFNPKPYLSSVKGYLDPGGAFFLAACSMALEGVQRNGIDPRRGIASATCYGSSKSAFTFYAQFLEKGSRFASPMVFPHGYANTPGNLAAIEYGYAGPHTVLYGPQNVCEALLFAYNRLQDGTAEEMLAGAYEALFPAAFPQELQVLNGAIVLRLAATPAPDDIAVIDVESLATATTPTSLGAVQQLGSILRLINLA